MIFHRLNYIQTRLDLIDYTVLKKLEKLTYGSMGYMYAYIQEAKLDFRGGTRINRGNKVIIVEIDNEPIGWTIAETGGVRNRKYIGLLIYVKNKYRGVGIGTGMIIRMKKLIKKCGYKGVVVYPHNKKSLKFFNKQSDKEIKYSYRNQSSGYRIKV